MKWLNKLAVLTHRRRPPPKETSCTGKLKRYEKDAKFHARMKKNESERTVAYKCQHCGYWHIGHN